MKRLAAIHPLLMALYPTLFLYSHNMESASFVEVVMPAAVSVCLALLLWLVLGGVLKNKEKGGLVVSVFLLLFFSYGHGENLISDSGFLAVPLVVGSISIGRGVVLFSAWTLLGVLCAYAIVRARGDLRVHAVSAGAVAASLVAISLVQIGAYELNSRIAMRIAILSSMQRQHNSERKQRFLHP